jgi:transcription initiation factor TFIIE subunit alpha
MKKIDQDLLEELVVALIGEDILPLIHILWNKRNVSEFKLAEKLNVTVNQVRNMLYRLQDHSLVDFMRKKDKKKGWYIYYWTPNHRGAVNTLRKFRRKQLADFKIRLNREHNGIFYVCPIGCMRLKIETAMDYDFKCQECGALLKVQDNKRTIVNIRKRIETLEKELEEDRLEVLAEREIFNKKYQAKLARAERKKIKEAAARKKEKDEARRLIAQAKRAEKAEAKRLAQSKIVKKKVVKKAKKKVAKKAKKKTVKKKVAKKTKKKGILGKVKSVLKKTTKKKVAKKTKKKATKKKK